MICMYYGKKANQFLYIHSQKELMDMIDKDAIVVQVTGNNKGAFINTVFENKFPGMDGNIYVMIRTIKPVVMISSLILTILKKEMITILTQI